MESYHRAALFSGARYRRQCTFGCVLANVYAAAADRKPLTRDAARLLAGDQNANTDCRHRICPNQKDSK
jgi:hypothetical protein